MLPLTLTTPRERYPIKGLQFCKDLKGARCEQRPGYKQLKVQGLYEAKHPTYGMKEEVLINWYVGVIPGVFVYVGYGQIIMYMPFNVHMLLAVMREG